MAQDPSEKIHLQADGIPVHLRVLQRAPNFFHQFRRQDLIRIQQQNPVVGERQRVHGPLAFLRPAARIIKLDHLRAVRLSNSDGVVRALRIDDVHFPTPASDCRQRGRLRASLRTGTITLTGRTGAAGLEFDASVSDFVSIIIV